MHHVYNKGKSADAAVALYKSIILDRLPYSREKTDLLKRASQANAFKYYARDRWDRMDYSGISLIKLYYVFYYIHGA